MRGSDPRSVLLFKDSSGLWIAHVWGLIYSQITLQPFVQSLPIKISNFRLGLLIRRVQGENLLLPARVGVESAWYSSQPCSPRSELRTWQRIASWSGEVLRMTSDLPPAWGDLNSGTPLKLLVLKLNPAFPFFSQSYQEDLPPSAYQDGDLQRQ